MLCKAFTLLSGFLGFPLFVFVISSFITRGSRSYLVALDRYEEIWRNSKKYF